jgi:hypothetical protein
MARATDAHVIGFGLERQSEQGDDFAADGAAAGGD